MAANITGPALALALLAPMSASLPALAAADDPTRVGDVSTTFRIVGRNDKIVVSFKYSREIALAGPAFLVYRFEGQTK